tara:strand:- start:495 stop:689 length:195 start_codon:yes stop_codon:yes gene_type:complete
MKIEINLYDERGERIVGKAIETDCQSLIINGVHVIQGGGVHAEMQQLTPADFRYNANLNIEDLN